jgi:hypothetical protein
MGAHITGAHTTGAHTTGAQHIGGQQPKQGPQGPPYHHADAVCGIMPLSKPNEATRATTTKNFFMLFYLRKKNSPKLGDEQPVFSYQISVGKSSP